MTRDQAIERCKMMLETARGIALRQEALVPTFLLMPHDGIDVVMAAPFADHQQKRRAFSLASLMCAAHDAKALLFVCEAWQAEGPLPEGVQPSTSDRRIEVVTCFCGFYDPDGDRVGLSVVQEMLRDATGAVSGFGEVHCSATTAGALLDLLPPIRVPEPYRAQARALLRDSGMLIEVGDEGGRQ